MTAGKRSIGLALAAATTAIGLGIAWLVLRERGPRGNVEMHFVEPKPASTTPAPASSSSRAALGTALYPESTFRVRPLTDDEFARFAGIGNSKQLERDPQAYFRYRAGIDQRVEWPEHPRGFYRLRTNALGLRATAEVRSAHPDLRIVVTGDSHTDGVCSADETYTALLERALAAHWPAKSVEALDAGVGGYSFFHYLGALERYLPLAPDVFVVGVFGGNDFEEALTLHHVFHDTERPPGAAVYGAELQAATEISQGAVVQGLLSGKYFAQNPGEVAVALQMARDVSSEIAATCAQHGVRPVFVYIPPLHDVEWDAHAELLERVASALKIDRQQAGVTDRMADEFIAFLRSIHVDVVDAREPFRASGKEMYWQADFHIDLDGQRVIAEQLAPVIEALKLDPRSREGDANASVAAATPDEGGLHTLEIEMPDTPLAFDVVRPELVDALFELAPGYVFDPHTLFARASSAEPAERRPELRVLLGADEVALAPEGESTCGEALEVALRAAKPGVALDCLDATTPGWGLYQQLGALDRFATAAPHAFVAVIDCANDFVDTLDVSRALHGDESGAKPARRSVEAPRSCIDTARELADARGDAKSALYATLEVALEMQRRCRARGIRFVAVLVPPASDLRVQPCKAAIAAKTTEAGLTRADLKLLERLSESLRVNLARHAIEVLDFGDVAESSNEELYDCASLRLGALGRQRLAEAIARVLAAAPKPR